VHVPILIQFNIDTTNFKKYCFAEMEKILRTLQKHGKLQFWNIAKKRRTRRLQ